MWRDDNNNDNNNDDDNGDDNDDNNDNDDDEVEEAHTCYFPTHMIHISMLHNPFLIHVHLFSLVFINASRQSIQKYIN